MIFRFPMILFSLVFLMTLILISPAIPADESKISKPKIRTETLHDPIFSIEFRPSEVQIQNAPEEIYKCKDLEERRGDIFMFGQMIRGNVHAYYIYGWEEMIPDGPSDGVRHFEDEHDDGIIVIVSGNNCRYDSAGYAWSPKESERRMVERNGITSEVASVLLKDAVKTEVQAFGGRSKFLHLLDEFHVDESKVYSEVREELRKLRDNNKTK